MQPSARIFIALIYLTGLLSLQAKPVQVSTAADEDDLSADIEGLNTILKVCSYNNILCASGGKMDRIAEKQFHHYGLRRFETHIMMQILRACVDDVKSCDVKTTVLAMEEVERISKEHSTFNHMTKEQKRTMTTLRLGKLSSLTTLYPSLFQTNLSYVFGRHGRKFERHSLFASSRRRRSLAKKEIMSRKKRSPLNILFHEMARKACQNRSCSQDREEDLPDVSEY